jgi:hypothetical protein
MTMEIVWFNYLLMTTQTRIKKQIENNTLTGGIASLFMKVGIKVSRHKIMILRVFLCNIY